MDATNVCDKYDAEGGKSAIAQKAYWMRYNESVSILLCLQKGERLTVAAAEHCTYV